MWVLPGVNFLLLTGDSRLGHQSTSVNYVAIREQTGFENTQLLHIPKDKKCSKTKGIASKGVFCSSWDKWISSYEITASSLHDYQISFAMWLLLRGGNDWFHWHVLMRLLWVMLSRPGLWKVLLRFGFGFWGKFEICGKSRMQARKFV